MKCLALLAASGLLMAQPVLRLKVPAAEGRFATQAAAGRGHAIVQFHKAPSPESLAELAARGARVLQYIPDDAVLIAADRDVNLEGLGVILATRIEPRQKISRLVSRDVNVVEFHPDVDLNDARRIVLNAGLELRENPDLGPHQLLVRGAHLEALAQHDEVAYIFPACESLASGLPTLTYDGGLAQYITTYGSGWDGAEKGSAALTYTFGNNPTQLNSTAARVEVARAMHKWSEVAAITFAQGSSSTANKNIHILWGAGEHGDSNPFDGPYGVLAHAYYPAPPNPEPIAGDLHFDDAEAWRAGAHIDVFSVALHELGHSLGLGHSDDPSAVMYPYYAMVSGLAADDRAAIRSLYATAVLPTFPPQPAAVSASPSSAQGSGTTFTFVFSDLSNVANLTGVAMLFNTSAAITQACYVVYEPGPQTVALVWDNANGSNRKALGSAAALENSYCGIGTVTASISGNNLSLTVPITFKPAFGGVKNIYMSAVAGSVKTGWMQRGSYTVVTGGVPSAQGVTPASGSGFDQSFQFTVSDPGGAQFITGVAALFATSVNPVGGCLLIYDRARGSVSIGYDNANGQSPVTPGANVAVGNSQCVLKGAATSVSIGATSIVLTIDLTFRASFAGPKNIYLYGAEALANTGWTNVGQWTVPGSTATAAGMSPAAGSGSWPSFTFTISDSVAASNLTGAAMLFTTGAATNQANACYVVYDRGARTIGLYDDAAAVLGTKLVGASSALQNSRCAVGYALGTVSGNLMTVTVYFYFKPAFAGAKTVYLRGLQTSGGSAWTAVGTWSVP